MCGFSAGAQENWLITQHISRQLSSGQLFSRVSVEVQYQFQICTQQQQCLQNFELHMWETSAVDSTNIAKKMKNFVRVGRFGPNNGTETITEVIDVEFDTEETGFYLALVDHGTCVVINQFLVFYEGVLCSGEKTGLIEHPEVIPPQDMVAGKCAANSATMNGSDPVIKCTDEGDWEVLMPCLCGPGFELAAVNGNASCTGKLITLDRVKL